MQRAAFQLRIAETHDNVANVDEAWRDGLNGLFQSWRGIRDTIGYAPVFDPVIRIVDILIDAPAELREAASAPCCGPSITLAGSVSSQTCNRQSASLAGSELHPRPYRRHGHRRGRDDWSAPPAQRRKPVRRRITSALRRPGSGNPGTARRPG